MSTDATPPALALLQQALGFWISRAICVVARLGIADLLKDGPLDTKTLAAAVGVHGPSLYRVLRTLASAGIFAEGEDGRFGLTPQAEALRSDSPDSIRDYILLVGEEWYSGPSDHLLHSVQTGRPAFERVHGADFFSFLAREPTAAAVFDAAMTSRSAQENDAIAAACDFSGLGTIIDVGGGHGSLLAAILRANPGLRGVLFDLSFAKTSISLSCVAPRPVDFATRPDTRTWFADARRSGAVAAAPSRRREDRRIASAQGQCG